MKTNTAQKTKAPPKKPRRMPLVDMQLYRRRVMEEAGLTDLEMLNLQLDAGLAFLDGYYSILDDQPGQRDRVKNSLKYESIMGWWAEFQFMFLNRCMRLILDWNEKEGFYLLPQDIRRSMIESALLDMSDDHISWCQHNLFVARTLRRQYESLKDLTEEQILEHGIESIELY